MIPAKCPVEDGLDLDLLAQFPFTGGNIKNVCLNAARRAAYKSKKEIGREEFFESIEKELTSIKSFKANYYPAGQVDLKLSYVRSLLLQEFPNRTEVVNTDFLKKKKTETPQKKKRETTQETDILAPEQGGGGIAVSVKPVGTLSIGM